MKLDLTKLPRSLRSKAKRLNAMWRKVRYYRGNLHAPLRTRGRLIARNGDPTIYAFFGCTEVMLTRWHDVYYPASVVRILESLLCDRTVDWADWFELDLFYNVTHPSHATKELAILSTFAYFNDFTPNRAMAGKVKKIKGSDPKQRLLRIIEAAMVELVGESGGSPSYFKRLNKKYGIW